MINKDKRKPLVGRVIGRLTVLEEVPLDISYNSNPKVKCQCSCGNIYKTRLKNILSKEIKSCGCIQREKIVNRTGQKIGKWTYLEKDEDVPSGSGLHWKCVCECGNQKTIKSGNKPSIFGCKECRDRLRKPIITASGYAMVYDPTNFRSDKRGYVLEHLIVMEQHIGRPVTRTETVHHTNGIRDDHRIENLELWDKNHPPGQRNSEKMEFYMKELELKCNPAALKEFCQQILKTYE